MAKRPTSTQRRPDDVRSKRRRLFALIERAKDGRLTTKEERELFDALDDSDRRSFLMLAKRFVTQQRATAKAG
jgi:hypothetical protein